MSVIYQHQMEGAVMSLGSPSYRLADGSEAHVTPDGHIHSAVGGVSFEESDGNGGTITVDTTPDPDRHGQAVQAFRKSRAYRREVRRLRPAPIMTTRRARPRGRRERRHVARATSSADPGSDSDPEPPAAERWRWASEASWRAFVASVYRRDFEREIARERAQGWSL
jgi:hypothetical protein